MFLLPFLLTLSSNLQVATTLSVLPQLFWHLAKVYKQPKHVVMLVTKGGD